MFWIIPDSLIEREKQIGSRDFEKGKLASHFAVLNLNKPAQEMLPTKASTLMAYLKLRLWFTRLKKTWKTLRTLVVGSEEAQGSLGS